MRWSIGCTRMERMLQYINFDSWRFADLIVLNRMRNYLVAHHSVTASKSLCVRGSRQDQAHRWRAKASHLTLRSYVNN